MGRHDDEDVKGRWCLGMGERKEKKKKEGRCGSDQGLCEMRVVCVWNRGMDQIGMGMLTMCLLSWVSLASQLPRYHNLCL